jgi:hypothetical protein
MKFDIEYIVQVVIAVIASGIGTAWLMRRKTAGEAESLNAGAAKLKSEVDEMTWEHAKQTIIQLQSDVLALMESRNGRDLEIARLKKSVAECALREEALIARIEILEAAIDSDASLVKYQDEQTK